MKSLSTFFIPVLVATLFFLSPVPTFGQKGKVDVTIDIDRTFRAGEVAKVKVVLSNRHPLAVIPVSIHFTAVEGKTVVGRESMDLTQEWFGDVAPPRGNVKDSREMIKVGWSNWVRHFKSKHPMAYPLKFKRKPLGKKQWISFRLVAPGDSMEREFTFIAPGSSMEIKLKAKVNYISGQSLSGLTVYREFRPQPRHKVRVKIKPIPKRPSQPHTGPPVPYWVKRSESARHFLETEGVNLTQKTDVDHLVAKKKFVKLATSVDTRQEIGSIYPLSFNLEDALKKGGLKKADRHFYYAPLDMWLLEVGKKTHVLTWKFHHQFTGRHIDLAEHLVLRGKKSFQWNFNTRNPKKNEPMVKLAHALEKKGILVQLYLYPKARKGGKSTPPHTRVILGDVHLLDYLKVMKKHGKLK